MENQWFGLVWGAKVGFRFSALISSDFRGRFLKNTIANRKSASNKFLTFIKSGRNATIAVRKSPHKKSPWSDVASTNPKIHENQWLGLVWGAKVGFRLSALISSDFRDHFLKNTVADRKSVSNKF